MRIGRSESSLGGRKDHGAVQRPAPSEKSADKGWLEVLLFGFHFHEILQ